MLNSCLFIESFELPYCILNSIIKFELSNFASSLIFNYKLKLFKTKHLIFVLEKQYPTHPCKSSTNNKKYLLCCAHRSQISVCISCNFSVALQLASGNFSLLYFSCWHTSHTLSCSWIELIFCTKVLDFIAWKSSLFPF